MNWKKLMKPILIITCLTGIIAGAVIYSGQEKNRNLELKSLQLSCQAEDDYDCFSFSLKEENGVMYLSADFYLKQKDAWKKIHKENAELSDKDSRDFMAVLHSIHLQEMKPSEKVFYQSPLNSKTMYSFHVEFSYNNTGRCFYGEPNLLASEVLRTYLAYLADGDRRQTTVTD